MTYQMKRSFGIVIVLKYRNQERRIIDDVSAFNIVDCIDTAIQIANKHNDSKDVK